MALAWLLNLGFGGGETSIEIIAPYGINFTIPTNHLHFTFDTQQLGMIQAQNTLQFSGLGEV